MEFTWMQPWLCGGRGLLSQDELTDQPDHPSNLKSTVTSCTKAVVRNRLRPWMHDLFSSHLAYCV